MGNPTLNAERARQRATDETGPQALSGWRPTVSANGDAGVAWNYSSLPKPTQTTPAGVAVTSAFNALAHAVEALYAERADSETLLWAEVGARHLVESLPLLGDGDVLAREQALFGACLAGACLGGRLTVRLPTVIDVFGGVIVRHRLDPSANVLVREKREETIGVRLRVRLRQMERTPFVAVGMERN